MKLEQVNNRTKESVGRAFKSACVASCRKILLQIKAVKDEIFAESRYTLGTSDHLLHLALNEAEAAAWQTAYPHLLFPALATEKVQALRAWNGHQRSVRGVNPVFARAA